MASFIFHPLTTFIAGSVLSIALIGGFLVACAEPDHSEGMISAYHNELAIK